MFTTSFQRTGLSLTCLFASANLGIIFEMENEKIRSEKPHTTHTTKKPFSHYPHYAPHYPHYEKGIKKAE